ncbi:amidohydrolase family protein [Tepidibacter hydrothermalis]|uniref:Amidohydrolase family protein n=1 Tax=Tepidibacter hydrothermalis TaxID=3036126 RepID=A0ABY8EDX6_9FIRM|nr:amidohydrolase family protein [Tepidibacter hydrothermalis]WFD09989.1 amidohydrolase family protein [Tepidibacter hydrothermalis]
MIDCHIHISLDGVDFKKARELSKTEEIGKIIRKKFKEYKKMGIYVLRDGGDDGEISSIARKIAKEEKIIFKSPVKAVYKEGRYGKFLGSSVRDVDDFKNLFDYLKSQKLDHLKIVLSGLVDFNKYTDNIDIFFNKKELEYIVNISKYNGIPVMAHVNSSYGIDMAIECGVDTIEHGYFIKEREIYKMAEKNIIWVPTLSPLGNLIKGDNKFKNCSNVIDRVYKEHLDSVGLGYSLGVKIALGSDSGCYKVRHVQGTFDEVNHLIKSGIKKEDVINMAIENGIKACNLNSDEIKYVYQNNKRCL